LGNSTATVTWVEFSDFQCPFCENLYTNAEQQILTNYINTGKVKMYYRDFPLPFHPNADPANAARCANAQGQFWGMHDLLFGNQSQWVNLNDPSPVFQQFAISLGLNNATFSSCYQNKTYENAIKADEATGSSYGVQGTPSNFLIIPVGHATQADLTSEVASLNSQYGGGITLYVNSDSYVVLIPGAYPYSAFDGILSKVTY
jgi:protein-disulfide isomerase